MTNNSIRAQKELVFDVTKTMFSLEAIEPQELRGYCVDLKAILSWAIRESRLHQLTGTKKTVEFNLKLDGRPLGGIQIMYHMLIHN